MAFLSLKGYSLDTLAEEKFSHRLASLLDEAERNRLPEFVNLEDDEKSQMRRASDYYSSKVFEYPAVGEALRALPGSPDTNTLNILIDAAEKLVSALQEPCRDA